MEIRGITKCMGGKKVIYGFYGELEIEEFKENEESWKTFNWNKICFYMGKLFQTRASEILRGWGLVRYNHSATSISPPNNLYIRGDLKNKILDPD